MHFYSALLELLFLLIYAEETDSNADRYRESDRSSNLSDVKADIRAGSSVSNAESVTALDSEGEGSTREVNALALAGPVPNPLGYRYSADYTEPSFPPKNNVNKNLLYLSILLHWSYAFSRSLICSLNMDLSIGYSCLYIVHMFLHRMVVTTTVTCHTLTTHAIICHQRHRVWVPRESPWAGYHRVVFCHRKRLA